MYGRLIHACLAAICVSAVHAAPPPVEDFFRTPEYQQPVLSPDGKHLAVIVTPAGRHGSLEVVDLDGPRESRIIVASSDADIANVHWVNDKRLTYAAPSCKAGRGRTLWLGLWAIDADGDNERQLIHDECDGEVGFRRATKFTGRMLPSNWAFYSTLDDGSSDVLIKGYEFDTAGGLMGTHLARLDTRRLSAQTLMANTPGHASKWWVDDQGHVAAIWTEHGNHSALLVPDEQGWKAISEGNTFTGAGQRFVPVNAKARGLLLVAGPDPEQRVDTEVLSAVDLQHAEAPPKVLLSSPGHDFLGEPIVDSKTAQLLGVKVEAETEGTVWFDPRMKDLQAEIDRRLPDTINQLSCHACLTDEIVMVRSSSDRQPSFYSTFDRNKHQLTTLLYSRPWMEPRQLGKRESAMYPARDGLSIPMMVTYPPGPLTPQRPAVVLVHGGPWIRGNYWAEWDDIAEAQFLASRGYVVVEPEFRGSKGYGDKLFRAGFKQWGLAMQNDISDAMDYAVGKGWIDAKRVCIGGASYGGYATLMGLAQEPDRYRCGFERAGVTDLSLMYSSSSGDYSAEWKAYGMPVMIGDPEKDAAQLRATSPIQLADRINKPLLMAYGAEDHRVPIEHGLKFRDAVLGHDRDVEWVVYPDEAHGLRTLQTNADYWTRVERLLARTIGPTRP